MSIMNPSSNLTVNTNLAQDQGRHPQQANRAFNHAARSAQGPRQPVDIDTAQAQGGFSSDEDDGGPHYGSGQQRSNIGGTEQSGYYAGDDDASYTYDSSEQQHGQGQNYEQGLHYQHPQQRMAASSMDDDDEDMGGDGQMMDGEEEEDEEEYDDEEDEDLSSSPSIPDENIDFDLVYALHTFVATVEGQATVNKGNSLTLLDDSNSYWWLVRVLRTLEVGYIPAENIETPFERLARLNKHRNVDLATATDDDHIQVPSKIYSSHLVKQRDAIRQRGGSAQSGKLSALSRRQDGVSPKPSDQPGSKPSVVFGPSSYVEHSGDELYSDEEDEEGFDDEDGEYEDDEGLEGGEDLGEDEIHTEPQHSQDPSQADVRARQGAQPASAPSGNGSTTAGAVGGILASSPAGRKELLAGMEPDDGMSWDARAAEQPQRQRSGSTSSAGSASGLQPQRGLYQPSDPQQMAYSQSQQQHHQQMQEAINRQAPARAPGSSYDNIPMASEQDQRARRQAQQQSQQAQQQQQGAGQPQGMVADQSQLGYGRGPGQRERDLSAAQSRLSSNNTYDQSHRPSSERSASSESGFLPSQVQNGRERVMSGDSAVSSTGGGAVGRGSPTPAQLRKEKERRKSKGSMDGSIGAEDTSASIDSGTSKEGKKRSGVFSGLFSRNKDKKDRKSGSFSNAGDDSASTVRNSEDSYSSNKAPVTTRVVSPGGTPSGLGRGVQERDRGAQEAYQRQFLSASQDRQSSGSGPGPASGFIPRPGGAKPRPGSLVGTPSSVPMLSVLRVFAGADIDSDATFKTVLLNETTSTRDLVRQAMQRFRLGDYGEYVLAVKLMEGNERLLGPDEKPLQIFDRLSEMGPEGGLMPKVKRSSVGSISSISSNLSLNPAIARANDDFSDDHAVKFYIMRAPDAFNSSNGPAGAGHSYASPEGLQSGKAWSSSDAYNSTADMTTSSSLDASTARSPLEVPGGLSPLASPGIDAALAQAPQARFGLRLIIFRSDLPEGTILDPQTNALIPETILEERGPSGATPAEGIEQRFREKVLSLPRNATVADVIELGLDRFGIVEGVVEGGDDVETRSSRRRSKPRIRYSLTVDVKRQGQSQEKHLAPNSRVVDAYPVAPSFKASPASKRRSNDSAMLLNMAEEQIRPDDPIFVLRIVGAGIAGAAATPNKSAKAVRSLSPTEGKLIEKQEQRRQSEVDIAKAALTSSESSGQSTLGGASLPSSRSREIIAAQRMAAQGRKAAVLGAQRNDEQGVDLILKNQGKIRSSKSLEGNVRYSYLATPGGQELDISSIVEDVLGAESQPGARSTSFGDGALRPSISGRGASTTTVNSHYVSAPSTPMPEEMTGGKTGAQDLLETFVRNPASDDQTIEERVGQVLTRVSDSGRGRNVSGTAGRTAASTPSPEGGALRGPSARQGSQGDTSERSYSSLTGGGSPRSASASTDKSSAPTNPTPVSTLTAAGATAGAGLTAAAAGTAGAAVAGAVVGGVLASTITSQNQDDEANSTSRSAHPDMSSLRRFANAGQAAYIPTDDFGLDHLYNIVDAASRRDPRKYTTKMVSRSASRARASATTPLGTPRLDGRDTPGGSDAANLSRQHSVIAVTTLAEPDRERLRPDVAGLFAPSMMPSSMLRRGDAASMPKVIRAREGDSPSPASSTNKVIGEKTLQSVYLPLEKELDGIDEGLDALLADALKAF
ncbi:unnamed protein product [Jaminaea pallidilutea]